jgi:predicted aminopeptidase
MQAGAYSYYGESLVLPILYGCVTYRSEFSANTHRTAFAFKLRQKSDTIYTQGIQRSRETPKDDMQMLGGSVFAD